MSNWHQSSDRREQNDPAVHKVGSDPGSDLEMQNPYPQHMAWHQPASQAAQSWGPGTLAPASQVVQVGDPKPLQVEDLWLHLHSSATSPLQWQTIM